jgi:hypothetical protein
MGFVRTRTVANQFHQMPPHAVARAQLLLPPVLVVSWLRNAGQAPLPALLAHVLTGPKRLTPSARTDVSPNHLA